MTEPHEELLDAIEAQIASINAKLDIILKARGLTPPPPTEHTEEDA